jgi:SAM-dependent methyltransferase
MDYSNNDFSKFWGDGYQETFCGYKHTRDEIFNAILKPFIDSNKTCLEIGCGGGFWTNKHLIGNFKNVVAIDVIPKSKNINCEYFQLGNQDYKCTPIKDNSVDFVFSFGVFCHLSNAAVNEYVRNVLRVLKPGGEAVLMFANWDKHPGFVNVPDKDNYRESPHPNGWYYFDFLTINTILGTNGIDEYTDLMPTLRDTVIHFKKN